MLTLWQINTQYSFDEKNSFIFQTRRNRKLNLTEYYDLVYEYKNDCLTAGIKYKKSYYADEDLRPTENLLFTITLFPLTSYEYQANELIDQLKKMKKFKKILLIFFYSLIASSNASAIENKILFKVNNEIITSIDILTELKYLETINSDFHIKMPKKEGI